MRFVVQAAWCGGPAYASVAVAVAVETCTMLHSATRKRTYGMTCAEGLPGLALQALDFASKQVAYTSEQISLGRGV
jgi:hypothetical protein